MRHNCYGKDREMLLEYRCTKCGDTKSADGFTDDELQELEIVLNKYSAKLKDDFSYAKWGKNKNKEFETSEIMLSLCEKLIERVREQ